MNFFTKVEDIQAVYKDFNDFPISFAVIPAVKDVSTKRACPDTAGNTEPRLFIENSELTNWLRDRLEQNKADVLHHGINHDYRFAGDRRLAEMQWRDAQPTLAQEIARYKKQLEDNLDYSIKCFVAPSNKISKRCLDAVVANGMDFSGIVPLEFSRRLSVKNLYNYAFRWWHRFINNIPWPGVLKYSDHLEVNACLLQSGAYLRRMFDYCIKHNLPLVINVHYWHLRDNPDELETLRSFVMDYALPKGAEPATVSKILNTYR